MIPVLVVLACYLIGGIPFGLLIGLWVKGVDIRNYGSGNLGATNAGRVLGRKLGYTVLALDALKGFLPLFVVQCVYGWLGVNSAFGISALLSACGSAAILGHVFPAYLKFKGGKGVATSIGVLMAIQPWPGICGFTVFGVVLVASRYVSLGSMCAAASVPLFGMLLTKDAFGANFPYILFEIIMAAVVVIRHRSNFVKIRAGKERKIWSGEQTLDDLRMEATDMEPGEPNPATENQS